MHLFYQNAYGCVSLLKYNHMRSGNKSLLCVIFADYVCPAYQDSIFEVGEPREVGVLKDTPLLFGYLKY